jgi:hypothetical protein
MVECGSPVVRAAPDPGGLPGIAVVVGDVDAELGDLGRRAAGLLLYRDGEFERGPGGGSVVRVEFRRESDHHRWDPGVAGRVGVPRAEGPGRADGGTQIKISAVRGFGLDPVGGLVCRYVVGAGSGLVGLADLYPVAVQPGLGGVRAGPPGVTGGIAEQGNVEVEPVALAGQPIGGRCLWWQGGPERGGVQCCWSCCPAW